MVLVTEKQRVYYEGRTEFLFTLRRHLCCRNSYLWNTRKQIWRWGISYWFILNTHTHTQTPHTHTHTHTHPHTHTHTQTHTHTTHKHTHTLSLSLVPWRTINFYRGGPIMEILTSATRTPYKQQSIYVTDVYWTVHHCDCWRIKNQLDVSCYI